MALFFPTNWIFAIEYSTITTDKISETPFV